MTAPVIYQLMPPLLPSDPIWEPIVWGLILGDSSHGRRG